MFAIAILPFALVYLAYLCCVTSCNAWYLTVYFMIAWPFSGEVVKETEAAEKAARTKLEEEAKLRAEEAKLAKLQEKSDEKDAAKAGTSTRPLLSST